MVTMCPDSLWVSAVSRELTGRLDARPRPIWKGVLTRIGDHRFHGPWQVRDRGCTRTWFGETLSGRAQREGTRDFLSSAVSLEQVKLRNRKCSSSTSHSGPAANTSDEELTEDSARIAEHFSLSAPISQPKRGSHAVQIIRGVAGENAEDHRSLTNDKGYKKDVRPVVPIQDWYIRPVRYNKRRTRITHLPSSPVFIDFLRRRLVCVFVFGSFPVCHYVIKPIKLRPRRGFPEFPHSRKSRPQ